ncbi:UDP-glucose 4-epimerase [Candidatus Hakubella thermalkaliphila]|uniref:UDP-glucose 4-epimerase n=3 Tax=Candidatus Hakubella thermalkaliphila TaxID=2754717 RepID=A0A6V8PQ51_9ACTN|nr:NAD-dependent epimerase/dehydratase family protein [Candidatus Hakubella thermalkaliphila]GFP34448.1 UDP-glucose 4-epimerase [Candidatus Hakubella thermalkaliphila]
MEELESCFRKKRVLITGGLGFIGSNLALRLVELGARVLLVDCLLPEYGGNPFNIRDIRRKVTVNIADVRDEASMSYLVKGEDYIFNLAGQVSHIDSMRDPYTDLEMNCRGHLSILEACRKNNREVKIVYAGTRQQYGKPDYLPVDEKHLMHPTDVNGINKMTGEWYHLLYDEIYGVRSTSLRLTNTYGPRLLMKHDRQSFIGWFIRQIIDGETITIYGDGSQLRDFTYVDDAVEAFLLVAVSDEANGEVFNLGGEKPISLRELVELLVQINRGGRYELVPFPEDRQRIDIGSFYADYSKISRLLGWRPKVSLEEGLHRTFDYYRKYKKHYW